MSKYLKLEYNEPTKRCNGEKKSKLLDSKSELYKFIHGIKSVFKLNGLAHSDRMDLHTEVLNNNETLETFLERVKLLEGRNISINDPKNYGTMGNAVVLLLGTIPNYNKPHITIAYFDNKEKTTLAYDFLLNYIKKI
jgi:hypothetical protein